MKEHEKKMYAQYKVKTLNTDANSMSRMKVTNLMVELLSATSLHHTMSNEDWLLLMEAALQINSVHLGMANYSARRVLRRHLLRMDSRYLSTLFTLLNNNREFELVSPLLQYLS
jgi:hypothetical protein